MEERPPIPPDPASPSDFPTTPAMPSEQPPWAGPPGGESPGPPPGAPGPEPIPWEQPGLGFFARNAKHALGNGTLNFSYPPLGGVLASAPGMAEAPTGEAQTVMPDAVIRGRDGYLRVFYDKIGVKFETYDRWVISGARIPSALSASH